MLTLDLKRPTIVVAGAWNPAIFQGGWIAQHLFGVPKGQQVQFAQLIAPGKPPKAILYLREVGISVSAERLELYSNDLSDATRQLTETTLAAILEKLPHTPVNAFGVNFHFVEDAPAPELFDLIDTKESLNEHYAISKQSFTSTILVDTIQLNVQRTIEDNSITIAFNYHHAPLNPDHIYNVIANRLDHAKILLRQIYGLGQYDVAGHTLDNPAAA